MQFHHARTAAELVVQLVALWSGPREDPFAFDLAVVPGAGFQRWLSQQLATADDLAGVCAGVEFASLDALEWRLDGRDNPWRPERLAWLVQQVATTSAEPELEVLRRHLGASRETYSAGRRIAGQFAGYARHRPAMLAAWADGADAGPDGRPLAENAWQAHLYRRLVAELGVTPVGRRVALLERLREAPVEGLPRRIAVLAPRRLDPATLDLMQALGTHHRLDALLLTPTPSRKPVPGSAGLRRAEFTRPVGHPLNEALGAVADEAALLSGPREGLPRELRVAAKGTAAPRRTGDTLLGWLQADLAADVQSPTCRVLAAGDHSVQVHLSHGRDRQVEVLREVLTAVLSDDPSLEPRDIAVITPDVDAFAPLLAAAFTAPAGTPNHPAQRFRVQVADRSVAQVNPMAGLLLDLLRLPDGRAEASTLLELCAQPAIAQRFGFGTESRGRLVDLVERAGIRWGLSATQRESFGLGGFPQNTWIAGLQRMLLGVTLAETDLVAAGTVLPLDDVESSDVGLVGGLTELVGRLSRMIAEFGRPATLTDWAARCRASLEELVELPSGQDWQLADVWSGLARLAERGGTADTLLTRHAALRALEQEFAGSPARGGFGNGALVVCGLDSLRHVPHRVIVLLGWDANCYPRSTRRHGDDLLGLEPRIGDPSPALADRQVLLDAVHAAGEQLVIIAQGRSEATNENVPLSAPIVELLEVLDLTATSASGTKASEAVTVQHPLQPFDPGYFDPARADLRSADRLALDAATALLAEPVQARRRYALEPLPEPDLTRGVSLGEMIGFFGRPAGTLLKVRTGISPTENPTISDTIPIEPGALEKWQIGNRVLHRLREGLDPEAVLKAEWLRGEVPPFALGQNLISDVLTQARGSVRQLPAELPTPVLHDLSLSVEVPAHGLVPLSGRVTTHARELVQVEYSSAHARHRLSVWLRLLALAASEDGHWRARLIGRGRTVLYEAPPQAVASALLGRYLQLYALGLSRPLPALPRLCFAWAQYRVSRRDPEDRRVSRDRFDQCWNYDSDDATRAFFAYPDLLELPASEVAVPGAEPSERTLVGALASSIWGPVMSAEVPS